MKEIQEQYSKCLLEAGHSQFTIESLKKQIEDAEVRLAKANSKLFDLDREAKARNDIDNKTTKVEVVDESVQES